MTANRNAGVNYEGGSYVSYPASFGRAFLVNDSRSGTEMLTEAQFNQRYTVIGKREGNFLDFLNFFSVQVPEDITPEGILGIGAELFSQYGWKDGESHNSDELTTPIMGFLTNTDSISTFVGERATAPEVEDGPETVINEAEQNLPSAVDPSNVSDYMDQQVETSVNTDSPDLLENTPEDKEEFDQMVDEMIP
jgi:hypothetical protein